MGAYFTETLRERYITNDDGKIDPRCKQISDALDDLQVRLDERCDEADLHGDSFSAPSDAREWVDAVLLAETHCAASLREQKAILFADCSLDAANGGPSSCERFQEAIMNYCMLVASVR